MYGDIPKITRRRPDAPRHESAQDLHFTRKKTNTPLRQFLQVRRLRAEDAYAVPLNRRHCDTMTHMTTAWACASTTHNRLKSIHSMSTTFVFLASVAAATPQLGSSASSSATSSANASQRVVQFQPGVRIDWTRHQVELDSEVILREGPLELFACSGGAKAHESIVMLKARPLHIFQALGLLGLQAGRPSWWDEKTRVLHRATGDPVDVLIEWQTSRGTSSAHAYEWMLDLSTDKPLRPTHWVFAGSEKLDDGSFGADLYGTVITVVDFGTSILTIVPPASASAPAASAPPVPPEPATAPAGAATDAQHANTADDLSLIPITERIPPLRTKVTIVLRPLEARPPLKR